jgi:photosystem II stability/assembly factor-like uncharacterized protein
MLSLSGRGRHLSSDREQPIARAQFVGANSPHASSSGVQAAARRNRQRTTRRPLSRARRTLAALALLAFVSLSHSASAQAAIAQVQKGSEATNNKATISPSLPGASTAGNLLVAVVANGKDCAAFSAPAGWVNAASACKAGSKDGEVEVWYYTNNPGAISSATFTAASGAEPIVGQLSEWSGVSIGSPLDQTGTATVTTNQTSATVSTSGATATSGELAVTGFTTAATPQTFTAGSGWSALFSDGTNGYVSDQKLGLAAGTVSETETDTKAGQWAAVIATFSTVPAGGRGSWSAQTSGDANNLTAVSCPDTSHCWAVDNKGGIIATSNGGTSWSAQTSGVANALQGISCPDASHCWAVDNKGGIIATSNGGTSWSTQTTVGTTNFHGIACTDTSHCWAVGNAGAVEVTSNGGSSWSAQTSGDANNLNAIECADTSHCWAVDNKGGIIVTTNGGSSWSAQTSGDANSLQGISCTDTSRCWAVDNKGGIIVTSNGGTSWSAQTSGTTQNLHGIDCLATGGGTDCWAVGGEKGAGTIAVTTNGGSTWTTPISTGAQQFNGVGAASGGRAWAVGNAGVIEAFVGPCSSGSLSLSAPGSVTWPSITLNGQDQTSSTTAALTPDDETANALGWNISATSTTFTNGAGKTLSTSATTITGASVVAAAGSCLLPTNSITYPVTLPAASTPPAASKVYNAGAASGYGSSTVTLTTQLSVPGKAYSGSYSSTWTFTISSGP